MKPNTCPYCGGHYSLGQSCTGPRTSDPVANTCNEMRIHRLLVTTGLVAAKSPRVQEDTRHGK